MHLTSIAIKRPITTLMAFTAIVLIGAISLFNLPINLLPDVNFPVLSVETRIYGYLPEEIENTITKPIEELVSTMNHIHSVQSVSSEGLSIVSIAFKLGTHMDYASAEVRERINLIKDNLPADAQHPVIRKYNPSDSPIVAISAHSLARKGFSSDQLREIVENKVEKQLKQIDGVANVDVKGGRKREIIIEIDHIKLKSLGIPILQIANLLEENNLNFQAGAVDYNSFRLMARTVGNFEELAQIGKIAIVRTLQGSIVYLKDIARIKDSFQKEENITRFQGEPRVMLYVRKESGANILNVSDRIQTELKKLKKRVAGEIELAVVYNQADFIIASIGRLRNEAFFGGILAMVVILLFLRNVKGVVIIATAIPISIMATLSMMYLFGTTLNIITLSGFTLGVGMLVDNAIVVLENIFKKRQATYSRRESALFGTAEVSKAIMASTIAQISVFLPVIFLQTKIRMLYSGLFFTVSFSLFASLIVAVTLIPAFSSMVDMQSFKKNDKKNNYLRIYRKILTFCLRKRGFILSGAFVIFCGSLLLIPAIGFEPTASVDRGMFNIVVRNPPGTRLSVADEVSKKIERIIRATPEVRDVSADVTGETAQLRVRLKPEQERLKTTRQVAEELRPQVSSIPNTQVHFDVERQKTSGNQVVIEVSGHDQKALMLLGFKVKERLLNLKEISDVVIHQSNPKPELQIKVFHDKAGLYGLDASRIAHAVRSNLTGPLPTEFLDKGKEIDIRVRLQEEDKKDFSVLEDIVIPVAAENGEKTLIGLGEVSRFNLVQGMAEIHRKDRKRMMKISAEVPKENLVRTLAKVKEELDAIKFAEGYGYNFGENYQEIRETQKEMIFAFCLAVVLVYMVLASLFESFVYPFTVMFSVPMAIVGSVLILYLTGKSISVPVYIGAITLAGISVNNSLVLVAFIKSLKLKGLTKWRAIIIGGESRLRPIIMTSGTTLLALLPMALDRGEGSNLWSPLALTIIGGLFASTFLTLFMLPILVSFIKDKRESTDKKV